MPLQAIDEQVDNEDHDHQDEHSGEDALGIEDPLRLGDRIADAGRSSEVFTHHGAGDGEAHADVQAGENPGQGAWNEHVTQELLFGGAQHPGVINENAVNALHTLKSVEEDDEENQGETERHL
ncbi:hypothetical protein D9M72_594700 [compost metagenome]